MQYCPPNMKRDLTFHFILGILASDNNLVTWLDLVIYDDDLNNIEPYKNESDIIDDIDNQIRSWLAFSRTGASIFDMRFYANVIGEYPIKYSAIINIGRTYKREFHEGIILGR